MRRESAGTIGFVVYAHSRSDHDRGFMGAYGPAAISLAGNRHLNAHDVIRFGPSSDFYDVGDFRDARWTGALTYRFALPSGLRDAPCSIAGTLHFSDGHGHSYAHRFRLAQYR